MNELVTKIKSLMSEFNENVDNFLEKENKSAARRARKNTLELEKLMKQFRKDSVEASK